MVVVGGKYRQMSQEAHNTANRQEREVAAKHRSFGVHEDARSSKPLSSTSERRKVGGGGAYATLGGMVGETQPPAFNQRVEKGRGWGNAGQGAKNTVLQLFSLGRKKEKDREEGPRYHNPHAHTHTLLCRSNVARKASAPKSTHTHIHSAYGP